MTSKRNYDDEYKLSNQFLNVTSSLPHTPIQQSTFQTPLPLYADIVTQELHSLNDRIVQQETYISQILKQNNELMNHIVNLNNKINMLENNILINLNNKINELEHNNVEIYEELEKINNNQLNDMIIEPYDNETDFDKEYEESEHPSYIN